LVPIWRVSTPSQPRGADGFSSLRYRV